MNNKMTYTWQNILSIIIGIMSTFVVLYRIIFLMIPMIRKGVDDNNIPEIFRAISLLV